MALRQLDDSIFEFILNIVALRQLDDSIFELILNMVDLE